MGDVPLFAWSGFVDEARLVVTVATKTNVAVAWFSLEF